MVSYFAIRELGYSGAELGKLLHLNRPGIGVVAKKREGLCGVIPNFVILSGNRQINNVPRALFAGFALNGGRYNNGVSLCS